MTEPLWQPDEKTLRTSNLSRFMAGADLGVAPPSDSTDSVAAADALHAISVAEPARFWSAVWDFAGILGDKGDGPFLVDGDRMPGARFFPDARLNVARNLLREGGESAAIVFRGEDKVKRTVSRALLARMAGGFQTIMDSAGLGVGDRVAGLLPNLPEAVGAMLGAAASGMVWSSCSPDFGVRGVLDRFRQIEPGLLIVCDSYDYNGRTFSLADKVVDIASQLPTLREVVIVPYRGGAEKFASRLRASCHGLGVHIWNESDLADSPAHPRFTMLPFAHPLYILFSSGTTGVPKCIVHSAGGTLLQHVKEQQLHCDIRPGDRVFYFTTLGWMMWNWLVSALASGATLMLYDGSPFHPSERILFDFAEEEGITFFGTSAKFIDALRKTGLRPARTHDLGAMRTLTSTGSPLAPEGFDFVYESIKPDVHLASISGGTDICGCFVLGNPLKPVWRGEIQGPGLAMAVDVLDDEGRPLPCGKGELVCTRPFPSMPIGFWNDPDGEKYRAAYFERFPGVWHHGDFAEWTVHGGIIIHGRSDATLNPGGVRIGTAEIYAQVEQLDEVVEAIAIGQEWEGDVRIVLFVVLREGLTLDDALRETIRQRIRDGASPRHVPKKIIQVADIPRTRSGKITELAVRDIVHGREVRNREALANPEALDLYRGLAELAR